MFIADTGHNRVIEHTVHASLTFPTAGQANVDTGTPFRWTDIPGGQGYQLWIGTKRGDGSLSRSGPLSANTSSYRVPALATGVTLWRVCTRWWAVGTATRRSLHRDGQLDRFHLPDRRGHADDQHDHPVQLERCNRRAGLPAHDRNQTRLAYLVNSGILAPNVTDYREPALPTGTTLYAKIVAKIAGGWTDYQAISFTAAPNPVAFTRPTQGQTAVGTPATFTWSTTPAATGYQMWIGTRRGDGSVSNQGG